MTEEERILLNELKANTEQLFQEFQNLETEKKLLEEKVGFLKDEIEYRQAVSGISEPGK